MDLLTVSRLKAFRSCARKHDLRYVKKFVPAARKESLSIGTLFHKGLEAWWNMNDLGFALSMIAASAHQMGVDDEITVRVSEMVRGYVNSWAPVRDQYEVVGVEQEFHCALINPDTMAASHTWEIAGKLDLVLREKATGFKVLVEHKTTSDDISDDSAHYFKKLALDAQLSMYHVGGESLGHSFEKIIYDVTSKPTTKRKLATPIEDRKYTAAGKLYANQRETDETLTEFAERIRADIAERPERYYRRVETVRLENEILESMRDVWHDARIIRESEIAGRAPRNPDACTQFGTCEYFDVCALGVDPEKSTMFRKLETAHPELEFAV